MSTFDPQRTLMRWSSLPLDRLRAGLFAAPSRRQKVALNSKGERPLRRARDIHSGASAAYGSMAACATATELHCVAIPNSLQLNLQFGAEECDPAPSTDDLLASFGE